MFLGSALAQRLLKINGPGALGDGWSRVGGCLPALVLPWITGPLLATTLWVGHIVHALMLLPRPWGCIAPPPREGAQLRAHLSGQGGGWSTLVASPRQDPASCGLRCTLWEAVGTLASQPPPLPVPEAQESGPGCAYGGLMIGQLVWRCVPGPGIGLSPP